MSFLLQLPRAACSSHQLYLSHLNLPPPRTMQRMLIAPSRLRQVGNVSDVFFFNARLHFRLQSVHQEARRGSGLMCRMIFFLLSCLGSNCSAACPSPKQADTETFKWLPFFSLGTHLTHDTSVSFTPGSSRPHYIFLSGRLCGYCAPRPHPFHLLPTRACKKKKNQGSG